MRIKELELTNFRSFEHCVVYFDEYYTAVSGKNNAGKSNLLKAIKTFFGYYEGYSPFYDEDETVNIQRDYPRWIVANQQNAKRIIKIRALLRIVNDADESIFRLIKTLCEAEVGSSDNLDVDITLAFETRKSLRCTMSINGTVIEDGFKKNEILGRIRSPRNFYFHNSTQQVPLFFRPVNVSLFTESTKDQEAIRSARDRFVKALRNVAKNNKDEISRLIGRLKDKYSVDVSIFAPGIEELSFSLSLGDKKCSTPISEWGSGTQNQTNILLALLRARKSSTLGIGNARFSPIIVIEEPESFLHPSAQAEFGRILMDLSEEFKVQIITTTHSIYMLNTRKPTANLLLKREEPRGVLRQSIVMPMDDKNWMSPFATVLGLANSTFDEWRDLIFSTKNQFVLVEGIIDKKYLEFFKDKRHGKHALAFEGEIYPYSGVGFFENTEMLKFIINCFKRIIITFDLDVKKQVEPKLKKLNLKEGVDYVCIGENKAGFRDIEGLLPDWVTKQVCQEHPQEATQAMSNDSEARNPARNIVKNLKCDCFIANAKPTYADCGKFYELIKRINKMLATM